MIPSHFFKPRFPSNAPKWWGSGQGWQDPGRFHGSIVLTANSLRRHGASKSRCGAASTISEVISTVECAASCISWQGGPKVFVLTLPPGRQSNRSAARRNGNWKTSELQHSHAHIRDEESCDSPGGQFYPRKSNLPGIQEKGCSARDPSPQQSASSDPSANRAGIVPQESHRPARFYTARVESGWCGRISACAAVILQRHPNCVIRPLGIAERAPSFWRQASDPGRHECV